MPDCLCPIVIVLLVTFLFAVEPEEVSAAEPSAAESAETRPQTPSIADDTVASELPVDEPPAPEPEPELPPPPPPPPKTEEDLWLYLKDVIVTANPMNMNELVTKLVETVKEVPQDFLEPVVEASIRRSQSMELSNAESLPLDPPPSGVEGLPAEGAAATTDGTVPTEGTTAPTEGAPTPTEGAPTPAPEEVAQATQKEPAPAEDASPVEEAPAQTPEPAPADAPAPAPAEAASPVSVQAAA